MKVTLAQQNYIVGDFENNVKKIMETCANNSDSDFIVFSELSLSGYYPWDLVYRENFLVEQQKALEQLLQFSKTISSHIVIGLVRENTVRIGKPFFNSLVVILNGQIIFDYDKQLLPTYNIFDEKRHFEEGVKDNWATFLLKDTLQTVKIGFFICEDGWNDENSDYITNPINDLGVAEVDYIIGINASPANLKKIEQREFIFSRIAKKYATPVIYVNQVGANDDIVFDGGSFVYDKNGHKVTQLKYYEEDSVVFDSENMTHSTSSIPSKYEMIFNHIGVGLKDYLHKQGITKVVVGSSGGIDSALTMALAKLHLGAENVVGITMPSKWSSEGSVSDSVELSRNLGTELLTYPILDQVNAISNGFNTTTDKSLTGLAAENLQARIRGTILMAYSNQFGHLLLTTGNKSEISVGYFTLYGDSNGGLNLIGDLYKTEVYALSRWINETYGELIPYNIIDKAPSAELAPDQLDTDNLPDYDHLDAILKKELEWEFLTDNEQKEVTQLINETPKELVNKVLTLIDKSEFKRKQSATIIRIHSRAFGSGRRIPIVQKMKTVKV